MRRGFDALFTAAGYLAGVFMIGTLLAVLAGVFGRLLAIDLPGADAYAGYCMAASAFLALAHTLRRGEHIRVTLILQHLGARAQHGLEIFCHAVAVFLAAALAWFSLRLSYQSWSFNDVSTGLDATPLWIPQIGMALGTLLFLLALVQDLLSLLAGEPVPDAKHSGELARSE